MKDFKNWGIKIRENKDKNYKAVWYNLKTIRLGKEKSGELPCDEKEFYDISLGNKCTTGNCDFCYVSSNPNGQYYENICELWKNWIEKDFYERKEGNILKTNKPFQIAIGSESEPTEHQDFCNFLKTVFETNIVPNYTTNGVILSSWNKPNNKYYKLANEILDYTNNFVGGVAVSFGNKLLRNLANNAIEGLINKGNTNINIHHIISTKQSVDEFVETWLKYDYDILYHVLLPLVPAGRSTKGMEEGVFQYLEEVIDKNNIKNIAFGAKFIKYLETSKIKTWLYDEHSLSANILLKNDKIVITKSSFDLEPIKIISL